MRTTARVHDPSSRSGGRDAETRNAPAERRLLRGGRTRTRMQRAARRPSRTGPPPLFWLCVAMAVVYVGLAIWALVRPDYPIAAFAAFGALLFRDYARRVKAGWPVMPLFVCQMAWTVVFVLYLAAVR